MEDKLVHLPPSSSLTPTGLLGMGDCWGHGPVRGALERAYLTYCPFQIDFNEALSVAHFLQLKQFPSGILLKFLFNLK
jgi:hypothetical protein